MYILRKPHFWTAYLLVGFRFMGCGAYHFNLCRVQVDVYLQACLFLRAHTWAKSTRPILNSVF